MGTQKVGTWEGRLLQIIMNIKHCNTYFGLRKRWSTLHIIKPLSIYQTSPKSQGQTQKMWPRLFGSEKKVTSVSIKWPHKDSFDQELAVWRILVFRHHLMIQTASRQSLSAFTLAYCWRISPVIEECVLWSRPVRRGLMATASRHGSYWHRASKTACKHLHCYELWSSWLMQ